MNQHLQKTIDRARGELERLGVDTHDVGDHILCEGFEKVAKELGNVGLSMDEALNAMTRELQPALQVYKAVKRWSSALRHGTSGEMKLASMRLASMCVRIAKLKRFETEQDKWASLLGNVFVYARLPENPSRECLLHLSSECREEAVFDLLLERRQTKGKLSLIASCREHVDRLAGGCVRMIVEEQEEESSEEGNTAGR